MRIGIIHYAAPPLIGGVELTIYHHARVLTALGHQVTVVAGRGDSVQPGVTYRAEPLAGSRGDLLQAMNKTLAAGEIPAGFETLVEQTTSALLKHLTHCEVVIGHNFFTLHKNLALTQAVYRLNKGHKGPPWVAWHHDFAWLRPQYQPELYPGDPWELLRRPWPGVRHVTVSQAQRSDLARLYNIPQNEITVIPPGVEPQTFHRLEENVAYLVDKWYLWEADCLFLLPARITRRKNIELGLHWLAAVRQASGWDARLIITGPPGPHNPTNVTYLQNLRTLQQDLGLENAVHFIYEAGPTHHPLLLNDAELANLFQVADAMLFPSRQEGFGIPILEAGLARLPIFATDLPPFRESAGSQAMLFPLDAPLPTVAQTIIEGLKTDRAFQLRRQVLKDYTWQRIVEDKIIPLLREAIAKN